MTVTYRDELGYVQVKVDNDGVQFVDGYAYFGNDEREYKIKIENLVSIGMEE